MGRGGSERRSAEESGSFEGNDNLLNVPVHQGLVPQVAVLRDLCFFAANKTQVCSENDYVVSRISTFSRSDPDLRIADTCSWQYLNQKRSAGRCRLIEAFCSTYSTHVALRQPRWRQVGVRGRAIAFKPKALPVRTCGSSRRLVVCSAVRV